MLRFVYFLLFCILFIFILLLSINNSQTVSVNYIFDIKSYPLSLLLIIAFILGMILGLIIFGLKLLKLKIKFLKLQRDYKKNIKTNFNLLASNNKKNNKFISLQPDNSDLLKRSLSKY